MHPDKEMIRQSIEAALDENPVEFSDNINAVLASKVQDVLATKKMEVSNEWLNDIKPSEEED